SEGRCVLAPGRSVARGLEMIVRGGQLVVGSPEPLSGALIQGTKRDNHSRMAARNRRGGLTNACRARLTAIADLRVIAQARDSERPHEVPLGAAVVAKLDDAVDVARGQTRVRQGALNRLDCQLELRPTRAPTVLGLS